MARCGCAGSGCSCFLMQGPGITVKGTGTADDPYVITSAGSTIGRSLRIKSSPTLGLTLLGEGTNEDPFILEGKATPSLSSLADVKDAAPANGDVPVFVTDHWEFRPPPSVAVGAVTATTGLLGDGSGANPLRARTSGVWGTGVLSNIGSNTLSGGPVYIDVNGDLRTSPVGQLSRAASRAALPSSVPGLQVYLLDEKVVVTGDGTGWITAGAGTVSQAQINTGVTSYFAANPLDPTVAALVPASGTTATKTAITALIQATAPAPAGFDTAAAYSVTGAWTFAAPPVASGTPTLPTHLATKAYVDAAIAAITANMVTVVGGGTMRIHRPATTLPATGQQDDLFPRKPA